MLKMVKYRDDSGGSPVIVELQDLSIMIKAFFDVSDHGQKAILEIVELTQEEYDSIPWPGGGPIFSNWRVVNPEPEDCMNRNAHARSIRGTMDKLAVYGAVYGQCPRCGGNLTVGHLCPKSMVHRSDLVKAFNRPQTKSVLEAIERIKVSLGEPDKEEVADGRAQEK